MSPGMLRKEQKNIFEDIVPYLKTTILSQNTEILSAVKNVYTYLRHLSL